MTEAELLEKTTKCIRCGFCLEACPTFVLTGQETESPRGRIYLVRSAIEGELAWDSQVRDHLDTCLGCRACEPACPSGVEYGAILEMARSKLETTRPGIQRFARKTLVGWLTNKASLTRLMAAGKLLPIRRLPRIISALLGSGKPEARLLQPEEPPLQIIPSPKHPQRTVYLLEGCVMGAAFQRAHAATINLLHHHDCKVIIPKVGCCGALHLHNGNLEEGAACARRVISKFDADYPIITHSAGCGSAMKEYGDLVGTEEAVKFSKRVKDISEYLAEIEFRPPTKGSPRRIAYHDACHLAHAQGIKSQPRELLAAIPGVELVEFDESDRCCGSAGIYNITQPKLARELLERKWNNIARAAPDCIVTGNPGCLAWLRQAADERKDVKKRAVSALHTAEFLWESYERT